MNHSELESDTMPEMSVTDAEATEREASDDEFNAEPAGRFAGASSASRGSLRPMSCPDRSTTSRSSGCS